MNPREPSIREGTRTFARPGRLVVLVAGCLVLIAAAVAAAILITPAGERRAGGPPESGAIATTIVVTPQKAIEPEVRAGSLGNAVPIAVDSIEPVFVAEINQLRAAHGLRKLVVVRRLTRAATKHVNSLASAGYFRHELYTPSRGARWTPFATWIRWYYPGSRYSSWDAAENLAWAAPGLTADAAIQSWMNSSPHRRNLLHSGWSHIGVAVVHVTNPPGPFRPWPVVEVIAAEFGRRSASR